LLKPVSQICSGQRDTLVEPLSSSKVPSFVVELGLKTPVLYTMVIQDPLNHLDVKLMLELSEESDEFESGIVTCHFPRISGSEMKKMMWDDEILCRITMVQYLMKIMDELLLFCSHHNASNLRIYTDPEQANELEVYQDFVVYTDHVLREEGEKIELIILTDPEIFDEWLDYKERVNCKFRQFLERTEAANLTSKHKKKVYMFQ